MTSYFNISIQLRPQYSTFWIFDANLKNVWRKINDAICTRAFSLRKLNILLVIFLIDVKLSTFYSTSSTFTNLNKEHIYWESTWNFLARQNCVTFGNIFNNNLIPVEISLKWYLIWEVVYNFASMKTTSCLFFIDRTKKKILWLCNSDMD